MLFELEAVSFEAVLPVAVSFKAVLPVAVFFEGAPVLVAAMKSVGLAKAVMSATVTAAVPGFRG
jgi:hypothetical protein